MGGSGRGLEMIDPVTGWLSAGVRIATPVAWAALGETVAERAGVINLGLEGAMLAGALGATLGASAYGPFVGVVAGAVAGLVAALLLAVFVLVFRVDQIIAGTAITLGAIGATGLVYHRWYGASATGPSLEALRPVEVPGLSDLPVVGVALFAHPVTTYLLLPTALLAWWVLFRTTWGLGLRAAGEAPASAQASGVSVRAARAVGLVLSGALAGVGGATLVVAQVGTFSERMTAGRGFLAIACVVLGRWHPVGGVIAALGFGLAGALQFVLQSMNLGIPYQLFLALPYLLALLALTGILGRARAPAALGTNLD